LHKFTEVIKDHKNNQKSHKLQNLTETIHFKTSQKIIEITKFTEMMKRSQKSSKITKVAKIN